MTAHTDNGRHTARSCIGELPHLSPRDEWAEELRREDRRRDIMAKAVFGAAIVGVLLVVVFA